jgi:hypothetical protein
MNIQWFVLAFLALAMPPTITTCLETFAILLHAFRVFATASCMLM